MFCHRALEPVLEREREGGVRKGREGQRRVSKQGDEGSMGGWEVSWGGG